MAKTTRKRASRMDRKLTKPTHRVNTHPANGSASSRRRGLGHAWKKARTETNERTNERTNAKHKPSRSLPDVTTKGDAILTVLREKGPLSPGALAKVLKLASTSTLAYQIKPLVQSGAVIATGKTLDRQFSLPPRSRAKEAP